MLYKRVIWIAAIVLAVAAAPVRAQSGIGSVRIYTDPPNATFNVDGQGFVSNATVLWPYTSRHTVISWDQDASLLNTRLVYAGWSSNLNPVSSAAQPITADPALQWIKLNFVVSYLVTINLLDCPDASAPCASAGRVIVNGITYDRSARIYLAAGAAVIAEAYPNNGYIFTGWGQVTGPVGRPTAFIITFALTEPAQLAPLFQPANNLNVDVNIQTIPPSLRILADRTPYGPPIGGDYVKLQWGWGTVHSLGAIPVQVENGTTWVFDSWSDGGAINHDVKVPNQAGALYYTATFVHAVYGTFFTSPPGLKLSIDGAPNFPESGFAWAPGSTHKISAPATQTDAQGHKYRFVSWSNGKSATFDHTVGTQDERFTATYQALGDATISSVPTGLSLDVDGAACTTPCAIEKDAGATVKVSAAALRNINEGSRLVFQGWGDSAETSRVIPLSIDPKTYTATYLAQNRLSVTADPPEGALITLSPSSPDGFYDAGSFVSIAVKLALGFRFNAWSGDFSGNSGGAAFTMDAPRRGTLVLDRVPAISPSGVRNAAATSISDGVAAGSLISIYGANLAPDLRVSPSGPLPQTLANITVRVDDAFLPLVLVSPGQINAQLPATLSEGDHKLTVRWEGKPETSTAISVFRNAPGLFSSGTAEQPVGSFVHSGGAQVTADSAARAGEIVGVLGTGFGPYVAAPPDGYVFDEAAGFSLVDSVTVVAGDSELSDIAYAGRSGAGVGVDAVRFRVPANLPDAPYLPVKIRINGRESNTVLLPIAH